MSETRSVTSSDEFAHAARPARVSTVTVLAGGAAVLAGLYALRLLVADGADIARGWKNPSQYALVQRLDPAPTTPPPARERGDFDGDGVDDELDATYLRREFVFAESTSGMLYVRSGASGEILLAHPLPTPMNAAHWCGDLDGDGRDDIWADSPKPGAAFAFRPR